MNTYAKLCFLFGTVVFLASSQIGHAGHVGLVGAANSTFVETNGDDLSPDGLGIGGGALFGISISPKTEIELGLIYTERKVKANITIDGTLITARVSAKTYQVPILFRHWFSRWISIGAGGYFAHYSSVEGSTQVGTARPTTFNSTIDGNDYGLTGSFALRVPFGSTFGLLLDARYLHGFSSDKVREIQGLAGLSFAFGK